MAVFRGRPLSPSRDAFFCSLAAGTLLTRLASFVFNLPIEKRRKIRPWGHGLFCRHLACEGTRTSEWRWTDAAQIRSQTCRRNYGGSWLAGWLDARSHMDDAARQLAEQALCARKCRADLAPAASRPKQRRSCPALHCTARMQLWQRGVSRSAPARM